MASALRARFAGRLPAAVTATWCFVSGQSPRPPRRGVLQPCGCLVLGAGASPGTAAAWPALAGAPRQLASAALGPLALCPFVSPHKVLNQFDRFRLQTSGTVIGIALTPPEQAPHALSGKGPTSGASAPLGSGRVGCPGPALGSLGPRWFASAAVRGSRSQLRPCRGWGWTWIPSLTSRTCCPATRTGSCRWCWERGLVLFTLDFKILPQLFTVFWLAVFCMSSMAFNCDVDFFPPPNRFF